MPSDGEPFLEAAAVLGHRIADSAIWYDGRCSWTGVAAPVPGSHRTHAALGPHLYDGTGGLALFLAEAAASLRDDRLRATALGAIRHALCHASRTDPRARDGLYAGLIGIAYAAARVGQVLEAEVATAGARDLLRTWRRDLGPSAASDVVDGRAGAVVGLLALAPLLDDRRLVDAAAGLGEELIERAVVSGRGWSWTTPGRRSMHNLCGLAHGASGIGHALIELFGATGDERFSRAAGRAFDYERSWLQPDTGTWPDLRGVGRGVRPEAPLPAFVSWCHGAPGIALARVRAADLMGAEHHDAEIALTTTRRHLSSLVTHGPADDFCLCHGAAGAADALLFAADQYELAYQIGLMVIERHIRSGASYSCGIPDGQAPGLFVGLAGIALFQLRLADPTVPSPLLIHPREP